MDAAHGMSPHALFTVRGLAPGPGGRVVAVPDGDTLVLDADLHVRLNGVQAPKLPLGSATHAPWPGAEASRAALEALVLGRVIRLYQQGARRDRHGRHLGQALLETDAGWVQAELVAAGRARVYSFPDSRACIADLLGLESRARAFRLGIWGDPYYALRRADRPAGLLPLESRFELVEGRVAEVATAAGAARLWFERQRGEGFSALVSRRAVDMFRRSGLDPLGLAGALVRIRGWMVNSGGPAIEVTHPEQVEVLAGP